MSMYDVGGSCIRICYLLKNKLSDTEIFIVKQNLILQKCWHIIKQSLMWYPMKIFQHDNLSCKNLWYESFQIYGVNKIVTVLNEKYNSLFTPNPFFPLKYLFLLSFPVGVSQGPWGDFEALHPGLWQCGHEAGSVPASIGQQHWLPDGPPWAGEDWWLQCSSTSKLHCTTSG